MIAMVTQPLRAVVGNLVGKVIFPVHFQMCSMTSSEEWAGAAVAVVDVNAPHVGPI